LNTVYYHITIRCNTCNQTLYDEQGYGGDEYNRLMPQAIDLKRDQLPAQHPDHDLNLTATTRVVNQP